jgi:Cu+-exporting ATPase
MTKEYRINGMMCVHCKGRVEKGLSSVEGVTSVTVDLDKKVAIVAGSQTDEAVESKVMELGYEYVGVKRGN